MRKFTLSLLCILAFAGSTYAQSPKFLIKAGLNIASLTNDPTASPRPGINLGVGTELFINDKFSIQPELLYSAQGARFDFDYPVGWGYVNTGGTIRLNYINVPIMAKYYITEGFSIQAGPQVGFLVKAEQEVNSLNQTITSDVRQVINSVDFGLNLGAGYKLTSGLFFDARYNFGLTSVNKNGRLNGVDVKFDTSSKNGVFQLSVGYQF